MEFQYTYEYKASSNSKISLECTLEYEPEELGSWSEGLQQEPNYPAQVILYTAFVGSCDVFDMLNEFTIEDIEKKAQKYYEGDTPQVGRCFKGDK
jgi:hypothetical protein